MTNWPVTFDPIFGCQLWTAKIDRDGYGISWRGRIATRAYVAVWIEKRGAIPDGKIPDHVCRRRACVFHLELVTKSENELRKSWRYRAKRATCSRGHDLKLHGIVTPEGGRVCRLCNREENYA